MSELTDAERPGAGMPPAAGDRICDGIFLEVDGHFACLNAAAVRLFGAASAGELIGQPVLDRVPSLYRPQVAERMRELRERSEPGGQFLHAAELMGANATLSRPIRADVLLDVVRRLLP